MIRLNEEVVRSELDNDDVTLLRYDRIFLLRHVGNRQAGLLTRLTVCVGANLPIVTHGQRDCLLTLLCPMIRLIRVALIDGAGLTTFEINGVRNNIV